MVLSSHNNGFPKLVLGAVIEAADSWSYSIEQPIHAYSIPLIKLSIFFHLKILPIVMVHFNTVLLPSEATELPSGGDPSLILNAGPHYFPKP